MTSLSGPTSRVRRNPNFDNLLRTLQRQGPPGPVPFLELAADPGMIQAVLGDKHNWGSFALYGGLEIAEKQQRELRGTAILDLTLRFYYENGYDCVPVWTGPQFPRSNYRLGTDPTVVGDSFDGTRIWQDEVTGPIQNWADFEAYPWPKPEDMSYRAVEYLNSVVPEGMKVSANFFGIFEISSWLVGFQPLCYALFDQPDLVAAICQRVGDLTVATVAHVVAVDNVGMVFLGDDLGFATATLVSPSVLRKHVFPQHRRVVETVHAAGKPVLFHSCGNVYSVMEEIIENGFAGKHSYEDKIMPVEDVYRRWGDRIAILGGVDMDLLARGSEEDVRRRVRQILEVCGTKGTGYCLGTGNTATNYIPKQNYLAMLDEGRRWNREHFG